LCRKHPRLTMIKYLFLVALVVGAVLCDDDDGKVAGYLCKKKGTPFKCFETKPDEKYCLVTGRIICGVCMKKFEYCRSKGAGVESLNPTKDCGEGWEAKQCDLEVGPVYP